MQTCLHDGNCGDSKSSETSINASPPFRHHLQVINPPLRSGMGIIGMPFICTSVRSSVRLYSVRSSVRPLHFRTLSISPEPFERFSLNFGKMLTSNLSETVCRTHNSAMPTQGQGQNRSSRSFYIRSIYSSSLKGFFFIKL